MHTSARKNCLALIATLLFTCLAASGQGRIIYSDTADAHKDIAQALAQARREHKRVILDFGETGAETARCWTFTCTSSRTWTC